MDILTRRVEMLIGCMKGRDSFLNNICIPNWHGNRTRLSVPLPWRNYISVSLCWQYVTSVTVMCCCCMLLSWGWFHTCNFIGINDCQWRIQTNETAYYLKETPGNWCRKVIIDLNSHKQVLLFSILQFWSQNIKHFLLVHLAWVWVKLVSPLSILIQSECDPG